MSISRFSFNLRLHDRDDSLPRLIEHIGFCRGNRCTSAWRAEPPEAFLRFKDGGSTPLDLLETIHSSAEGCSSIVNNVIPTLHRFSDRRASLFDLSGRESFTRPRYLSLEVRQRTPGNLGLPNDGRALLVDITQALLSAVEACRRLLQGCLGGRKPAFNLLAYHGGPRLPGVERTETNPLPRTKYRQRNNPRWSTSSPPSRERQKERTL